MERIFRERDGFAMKNLILIGMPGSGKSTVGVLCAKALGMPFMDTDLVMQARCGQLLQQLVDELGTDGFLYKEEECILGIDYRNTVIATGGSVALEERAMAHLEKNGVVFYLRLPCEELERRMSNMATRGIAMGPGQTLRSLYDYRAPHYEKHADVIIDADGQTLEETVQAVVSAWRQCKTR